MDAKLMEAMETNYAAGNCPEVLRLGKPLTSDEQLKNRWFNSAAFSLYSWGYLTGVGNTRDARKLFRECVSPEYISRNRHMSAELIHSVDEKYDAGEAKEEKEMEYEPWKTKSSK